MEVKNIMEFFKYYFVGQKFLTKDNPTCDEVSSYWLFTTFGSYWSYNKTSN